MAREPFNRIWTETPTVDDFDEPTNAMWNEGWRGGAAQDPPEAFAQNWWQNRVDYALQQIERHGYMDYDTNAIYQHGGRARGSDGNFYISITDPNTGNDPVSDGGVNWILDPVNDMTMATTGHYRTDGGFLIQWVKSVGLSSPGDSIGSRITHPIEFQMPFSILFGAIPVSIDNAGQVQTEGSEMSCAIQSQSNSSVSVTFTRISGQNPGGDEVMDSFVIAVGI